MVGAGPSISKFNYYSTVASGHCGQTPEHSITRFVSSQLLDGCCAKYTTEWFRVEIQYLPNFMQLSIREGISNQSNTTQEKCR